MKKMILMAVALLSMSTAFAKNENVNSIRAAYTMNVNTYSLGRTLGLTLDQVDAVDYISNRFRMDMYRAGYSKENAREERMNKAIRKNLQYMRSVLNHDQYRTYVQVLNATLHNRGLK